MDDALDNPLPHSQVGDSLIASGIDRLSQGWQSSSQVIGKIWSGGAERWQATVRQIRTTADLAAILRSRNLLAARS